MQYCKPRGTSLIGKAYEIFSEQKDLDGFFLKTKGFSPKVCEIFRSEMLLVVSYADTNLISCTEQATVLNTVVSCIQEMTFSIRSLMCFL